jgi:hypothetical protein
MCAAMDWRFGRISEVRLRPINPEGRYRRVTHVPARPPGNRIADCLGLIAHRAGLYTHAGRNRRTSLHPAAEIPINDDITMISEQTAGLILGQMRQVQTEPGYRQGEFQVHAPG